MVIGLDSVRKCVEVQEVSNYVNWYNAQNYDRVIVLLPKGSREKIKAAAKEKGLSANEFIKGFLPKELIAERQFVRKNGGTEE